MASFVPPKKNDSNGYTFYVSLAPRTATGAWQANPTLAAGDVKIAIDDGAPANLGTLPAVDADYTKRVKVVLSQAETNGDNLTIIFSDAAGAEWCDLTVNLQTAARGIDDLAFPNTSGRGLDVSTDGDVEANVTKWLGTAAATPTVAGVPEVDVTHWIGTAAATPTVAGVPEVDVTHWLGTAGQGASGRPQVDVELWLGSAPNALISGRVDGTIGAVQTGALTAAGFAAGAIDAAALAADAGTEISAAVWAAAARTLTALDEDSTTLDLDATIRAAVGLAAANLDTQLTTIDDFLDTEVAAIKAKTDSLTFTVAGVLDANIQRVNDVAVTGTGVTGDTWGPA